jgi:hypothetical protein
MYENQYVDDREQDDDEDGALVEPSTPRSEAEGRILRMQYISVVLLSAILISLWI